MATMIVSPIGTAIYWGIYVMVLAAVVAAINMVK